MFAAKNMLLAHAASVKSVMFSSAGAGANVQGTFSTTLSETHVISSGANYLLAAVSDYGTPIASCTCGGTAMTLLQSLAAGGDNLYIYGLANPTPGSQTITANTSYAYNSNISLQSVAYSNVVTVGTPITANGSSTTMSVSASSVVGQMLFNILSTEAGTTSPTGYSQTARGTYNNEPTVIGDAAGTGSTVTFSASIASSGNWGGIIVPLSPT